ncbi:ATP-dependent RNA helicase ddx54 [Desmophyllum pertusum]|uniref:RNA helicase n=1 Tax=Desmophyllum pertusum TaxID=174260 RepID=A0A9W9YVY9_9CNID|nr:ATP-dependent RNA helicase ddx54 [Desmophyllum pertusum]
MMQPLFTITAGSVHMVKWRTNRSEQCNNFTLLNGLSSFTDRESYDCQLIMAKKKSFVSSKGKPSTNSKQKKGKKGGKTTTPQNFRRKKGKDKEIDEFDEVETGGLYNHEEDEHFRPGGDGGDDDTGLNTRGLITEHNKKKKKSGGFQSMGLSFPVFKGVMKKGYRLPTPIQRKTIPVIMEEKDVVAMARTGSGKTAAFLIPMFERLKTHSAKVGARGLILSPTRELALQTLKFTKELGRFTGLKAAVILGGDSFEGQFAALHGNPDIIVATPGRFLHVMMEMDLKLSAVEYVVFDEADRLFEMGFAQQLHEIINRLPDSRQTLLFSATLPKLLVDFTKAGLTDPVLIRLDVDSKLSEQLKLAFFSLRSDDKPAVLLHILQNLINPSEQTLVFTATKHHVEYLKELLEFAGIECSYVYSTLDPAARKINIGKFQHKKTNVMVVTDVAARGIDIPMLDNVINYNFPAKSKLFIHRVGRVARAGRSGTAYSLVGSDELAHMVDLHLFLGRPLKLAQNDSRAYDDGLIGSVPQLCVDDEENFLKTAHDQSHDLISLRQVAVNGYKQYIKSRPSASSESSKRAKQIDTATLTIHPLFRSDSTSSNEASASRVDILDGVRNFRPRQTIFEIGSSSKSTAQSVMMSKRKRHSDVIQRAQRHKQDDSATVPGRGGGAEREEQDSYVITDEIKGVFATVFDPSQKKKRKQSKSDPEGHSMKNFRDENYIPHTAADYYGEKGLGLGLKSFEKDVSGAVMDIQADEDEGMRQANSIKRWDRKRKNYVGEDGNVKKIRTESGVRIPATYKKNIYQDWLRRTKMDLPGSEDREENETRPGHKKGKKGKGGKKFSPKGKGFTGGKGAKPRGNELKSKDQILKARHVKEATMQRQNKGKPRGKAGKGKPRGRK